MDPINQTGAGSKKGLYIGIGIVVVLILAYLAWSSHVRNRMYEVNGVSVDNNLDGSKTVTTPYGTATTSNKMPEDWPSDAPVYANGTIQQSTSSDIAGTNGLLQVSFTTSDDFQTILDFYKKELTTSGWVSLLPGKPITGTQMGGITTLGAKKGERNFTVMITTNKETGKQVVNVGIMATPDARDYKTGL